MAILQNFIACTKLTSILFKQTHQRNWSTSIVGSSSTSNSMNVSCCILRHFKIYNLEEQKSIVSLVRHDKIMIPVPIKQKEDGILTATETVLQEAPSETKSTIVFLLQSHFPPLWQHGGVKGEPINLFWHRVICSRAWSVFTIEKQKETSISKFHSGVTQNLFMWSSIKTKYPTSISSPWKGGVFAHCEDQGICDKLTNHDPEPRI